MENPLDVLQRGSGLSQARLRAVLGVRSDIWSGLKAGSAEGIPGKLRENLERIGVDVTAFEEEYREWREGMMREGQAALRAKIKGETTDERD